MTKCVIRKYKILLSIIPIMISSNISVGEVTTTNQPSIVSVQNISEDVRKLSDKTQQLENKVNIVNEQYLQILQEYKKQSNKLSDIEHKQDTLQNQIQSSNFNINEIRKDFANSNPGTSNFPKDDTFLSNENNKFAKQQAQNIFSELQNAKTIDERKAIFDKYQNELNFINPSDKMKYISGDLPIDQSLNKQLTDNTVQKYNAPVYNNSNLFNSNTSDKTTMQHSPNIENNNIVQNTPFTNTAQQLPENILDELQQATTPEARQEILKKYPSISEVIDNNNIKQYLENGVPFTQKAKEQISAKISADNIINKLKDPNISKEEKQKILQDHPAVLQTLGNPSNIDQYLNGSVPFQNNFSDELSQNLLADNILKTLNNPKTTPQQRHEILQQYPEIIQMINNGDSNIDKEKYNNYINGKIPFPPILKDSLSQKFITDNAINKMTPYAKQSLVSETPELPQVNQQLQTDTKSNPFNINNMKDELSKNKSYNTPLKDSNDILMESKNRPNLDEIYNEMSKANNSLERINIVNKHPELKNIPGINEYIRNGKQIDFSPIQSQVQDNNLNKHYNELINNIAKKPNSILNNQNQVLQPDINNKNIKFEILNDSDFPRYSKDDSNIDFIKMSKEQLISELQKCKNTCKLLQNNSNIQSYEVPPAQVTIPDDLEMLKEPKQDNVMAPDSIMPQIQNNINNEVLNGIKEKNTLHSNNNEEDAVLKELSNKSNQNNDKIPNTLFDNIISDVKNNNTEKSILQNTNTENINTNNENTYDITNNEIKTELNSNNSDKGSNDSLEQLIKSDNDVNNKIINNNILQNIPQEIQNSEAKKETQQHEEDDVIELSDLFKDSSQTESNTDSINKDNKLPLLKNIITGDNTNNEITDKQLANNNVSKSLGGNTSVNNLLQENTSSDIIKQNTLQLQNGKILGDNMSSETKPFDKLVDANQVSPTNNVLQNTNIINQDHSKLEKVNNIQVDNLNQLQSNEQNELSNSPENQSIDNKVLDNIIENKQPTTNEGINTAYNQLSTQQNNINVDSNNIQNNTFFEIPSNAQENNKKVEQIQDMTKALNNNSNS